jgi:hypothetical protein
MPNKNNIFDFKESREKGKLQQQNIPNDFTF